MPDALVAVGSVVASGAMGVVSALVPFVNAEVYAVALSTRAGPVLALACAVALATGQTGGKWVWYTTGRRGVERRHRKRGPASKDALAAAQGRLARLCSRLHDRRSSAAVVLLSGSVGLPPLALVSVAAGATMMRAKDFLACCLLGRTVRFSVVLLPLALR